MSRNGSGTYNLPAGNPVVTGTTITTTWANTTLNDIASSLTGSVASDGQTPMTGALNMGNNKVIAVTDPTNAQDAATKAYVDLTQTAANISGGVITGAALTNDTIDNSPIGNTTRSSVKATTLDLGLATQSVAIGQGNASIMKNRIINGAMVIDQRNAGASVAMVAGSYTLDRWLGYATQTSKATIQQNAGSVTAPVGFSNYLGATSLSAYSVTSTDKFTISQAIEGFNTSDLGFGTANAKTITISAWVYSSLTGTFGGSLSNYAGTRSYPFTYSIPVANTWTQISVTIAGDTSGTWTGATNSGSLVLGFSIGAGTSQSGTAGVWASASYGSATGATSVVGTNGATFYITGVQLEVGSSATGFEYRQYQQELALCQRYTTLIGSYSSGSNISVANGSCNGGSAVWRARVSMQVPMRANPTVTFTNLVAGVPGSSNQTVTAIGASYMTASLNALELDFNTGGTVGSSGQTGCIFTNTGGAAAYLLISAEL